MKKIVLIFTYLMVINCFSQEIKEKKFFAFGNLENRVDFYQLRDSSALNPKKFSKKFEKEKKRIRTRLFKNLKGEWNLISVYCPCCVVTESKKSNLIQKTLKIDSKEILFYEKSLKEGTHHIKRKEKVQFLNEPILFLAEYTDLMFSNNELWSFKLTKDFNYLQIYKTGEHKNNKGYTVISSGVIYYFYERNK